MLTIDIEQTTVVFRKWKDTKTVIALFPELEHRWPLCLSYEHVGQHGGADYVGVIQQTMPANETEYRTLYKELTTIGYNLHVRRRRP